MNKIKFFWKNKIIRKLRKIDYIYLVFWIITFSVLFLLMTLTFNKLNWYKSLFTISFLILGVTVLALVIKWGLFDIYSKGIKNWNIKRENKILKENQMEEKELISIEKLRQDNKEKSYLNIFIGLVCFLILFIISLPFILM
ncbi:DUF3899 domain-containing protein [Mycoplasma sp. 480]|uniref:DUF3899 domain-containing protein n=1 Tax=Mycoplasma sp. 480 TaxID=3440155 RepID=UPI003F516179